MSDPTNPDYYRGRKGLQCIDVIEQFKLGYCLGSAVAYILRCGRKPGADPVLDLQKARWMIEREIAKASQGADSMTVVEQE